MWLSLYLMGVLQEREDSRDLHGYRNASDQIRYHQTGTARGWLQIEGKRTEIRRDTWGATLDKSALWWACLCQMLSPTITPGYRVRHAANAISVKATTASGTPNCPASAVILLPRSSLNSYPRAPVAPRPRPNTVLQ